MPETSENHFDSDWVIRCFLHDSATMPDLLHLRNTLLEHRHGLLVRSVAVLLRPEADSPALTGMRQVGFPSEEAHDTFRYRAIRVWQLPAEALLAAASVQCPWPRSVP